MASCDADFDLAFSVPLQQGSAVPLARWERKQKEGSTPGKQLYADRFITTQTNSSLSLHSTTNENVCPENLASGEGSFRSSLAQSLFHGDDLNSKILACKKKAPKPSEGFQNNLRVLYTANKTVEIKRSIRHISSTPERILDAPDLLDDYYLNLMDWSASSNLMSVALGRSVYVWNPATGAIDLLFEAPEDDYVSSVAWMGDGNHIALGMSDNSVLMWNVERQKQVRCMRGHAARVGSLAWNSHVLSSGSRDANIFHHDVRVGQHHFGTLKGHSQEVCGLRWSPDGSQLASGANDNVCCIWDASSAGGTSETPRFKFAEASAAVKALAWSPHDKNLLATGAGTADRHIRFYDTISGSLVNSIDTNSQVCSLVWNKHERELLSSHGFSENQLIVWKCPSMVKVAELTGHTSRVLHTALSADGTTVCSAAADETLRFWKVFDAAEKKEKKIKSAPDHSKLTMALR